MSVEKPLPDIAINDDCNYIAVFLTMACQYRCSYCINEFGSNRKKWHTIAGRQWVEGLTRLANLDRPDGPVPVTLQGGEPSLHPDFYHIVNNLPERIKIDVLTNLAFDVEEMIEKVDPARLRRDAPYASIRVSYHPDQVELDELLAKTHRLLGAGFHVGIWAVLHPSQGELVLAAQRRALAEGIDFRTKDFLGFAYGKLYGNYKYPEACFMQQSRSVLCRSTELLIAPDGGLHRCHHDLYDAAEPIGNILAAEFQMTEEYRPCDCYGHCNPCDIKVKTNRLQQFGHTSVDIKFTAAADIARPKPLEQTIGT